MTPELYLVVAVGLTLVAFAAAILFCAFSHVRRMEREYATGQAHVAAWIRELRKEHADALLREATARETEVTMLHKRLLHCQELLMKHAGPVPAPPPMTGQVLNGVARARV